MMEDFWNEKENIIALAAVLFVIYVLLRFFYKWVKEDREKYYVLLLMTVLFGGIGLVAPKDSIVALLGSSAMSVTMTLFLVHLAEPGGEKKTKLLLTGAGAFFGVIFYGAFFFGIPEPKKENAVMIAGILSALAMGQLGGWLECCLFGEKEPPAPSNGRSPEKEVICRTKQEVEYRENVFKSKE